MKLKSYKDKVKVLCNLNKKIVNLRQIKLLSIINKLNKYKL